MKVNFVKAVSFTPFTIRDALQKFDKSCSNKASEYYLKEAADDLWKTMALGRNILTQYYESSALF